MPAEAAESRFEKVERSENHVLFLAWSTFYLLRISFLPLRLVGLEVSAATYGFGTRRQWKRSEQLLIFVRSLFRRAIAAYAYSLRLALEQQSKVNTEAARTLPGFLNKFDRR